MYLCNHSQFNRTTISLKEIPRSSDNETDASVYSVVNVKVHKGWHPQGDSVAGAGLLAAAEKLKNQYDNDIALLTLDRQVEFLTPYGPTCAVISIYLEWQVEFTYAVYPICIPRDEEDQFIGENAEIAGVRLSQLIKIFVAH